MFGISCIPALGQAIGMVFLPYSPRWLLLRGQEEKVKILHSFLQNAEILKND